MWGPQQPVLSWIASPLKQNLQSIWMNTSLLKMQNDCFPLVIKEGHRAQQNVTKKMKIKVKRAATKIGSLNSKKVANAGWQVYKAENSEIASIKIITILINLYFLKILNM